MDFSTEFVDAVKATLGFCVEGGYVVAIVGKIFAGSEAWALADDFVALDDELRAIGMRDHPFPPQQCHGVF